MTDVKLLARRERLVERFAAMQLDLGGAYYEMAIRDHVRHDVLTRKAAELQRVDAELREVDALLESSHRDRPCPACAAPAQPAAAFCSRCGQRLEPSSAAEPRAR